MRLSLRSLQNVDAGRHVFIKFKVFDRMFSVTNLFSPNQGQVLFCLCSLKLFKEFAEGTIILAGDLNLILDNSMDTTGRPSLSLGVICISSEMKWT